MWMYISNNVEYILCTLKVTSYITYIVCFRHSRIGTLYFDSEKLKDWAASLQQTMALFERIRTVGKGIYVCRHMDPYNVAYSHL